MTDDALSLVVDIGEPTYSTDVSMDTTNPDFVVSTPSTITEVDPVLEPPPVIGGDSGAPALEQIQSVVHQHVVDSNPHPVYDDGPSLALLYLNTKV